MIISLPSIIHQQQPDDVSCMSACLAMITQIPVMEMVNIFHHRYKRGQLTAYLYLQECDIDCIRTFGDSQAIPGELYILSVPSLNKQASTHAIVVDFRFDVFKIYDPNEGRENKLYYIPWDQDITNPLQVKLKANNPLVLINTKESW